MMSVDEAAKYLNVSAFTLRSLARDKKIPGGKVGRRWRFRKEDLDEFLKDQYGGKNASDLSV